MSHTSHPILGDCQQFLAILFSDLELTGIKRKELAQLDHIAYRVESFEEYEDLKISNSKAIKFYQRDILEVVKLQEETGKL